MAHHYPDASDSTPDPPEKFWCVLIVKEDDQMCIGTIDTTPFGGEVLNKFYSEAVADLVVELLSELVTHKCIYKACTKE